jgi:UDP-3-O-[3-hydroxymyristoyl] N-acetylglucosamine deacetylase
MSSITSYLYQRTLKNPISATGIGLHHGERIELILKPAPANTGIVFRRTDLVPAVDIPATAFAVVDTRMNTTLGHEGAKVSTVEHLLSALAGLWIDNLIVEISSDELPVMDGSANPFVFLIQSAGIQEQTDALKKFLRIKKTVRVEDGDKWASLSPYDGFKLNFSIEFDHPLFDESMKQAELDFSLNAYIKQIGRARTFGFLKDYEMLKANNLAKGGSLDNAVVIDDEGIMNAEGLRSPMEIVNHKILDAIGDLYLFGASLIGHYEGHKSGHALNNKLIRSVLSDETAYEWISFDNLDDLPHMFTHTIRELGQFT